MSFEPQTASHCGVCSLRYVLSLLGVGWRKGNQITAKRLRKAFRKSWWRVLASGVDEGEIQRAAERMGLQARPRSYRRCAPERFLADLRTATNSGHMAIVSWHDDEENDFHWVCVAGFNDDGRVILFDPAMMDDDLPPRTFDLVDEDGERVPGLMSAKRFRQWITPEVDPEGGSAHFFLEVWPAPAARHDFVKGRITAELLEAMRSDGELIEHYDEYIDDLRDIFGAPSTFTGGEPAWRFLERRRTELLDLIDRWTLAGACPPQFSRLELETLTALARSYDFRVRPGTEADVMAELGFHLGWRACERSYDVGRYE